MDRFCVGDAAYHALVVLENDLPRSYMIKQCRNDIDDLFVITRTPGELTGAQISFKDELQRKVGMLTNHKYVYMLLYNPGQNFGTLTGINLVLEPPLHPHPVQC